MLTEEEVRSLLDIQGRIGQVADDLARLYYRSQGWEIENPGHSYRLEEITDEEVVVSYQDYDRDVYRRAFPLSLLWDKELQQRMVLEGERREALRVENERQLAESKRQALESRERAQLASLIEKYGRSEE